MKNLYLKYYKKSIPKVFTNFKTKYYFYWASCSLLLLSATFLLNLSFGQTNGIENNLQPMPSISVDMIGKANLSFPIDTPDNTGGVEPTLSLNYSSSGGFGNMGVGWNLAGIQWITRDATYGIDYSSKDQFTSTLGGSLVDGGDGNHYSRKETFMKFVPVGSYGPAGSVSPSYWVAYDKSGTRYIFNSYKFHDVASGGDTVAVWALASVNDIYGNGYSITYSDTQISMNYADRTVIINLKSRSNTVTSEAVNTPYPNGKIVDSISMTAGSNFSRNYTFSYGLDVFGNERLDSIGQNDRVNGENILYTPIDYSYSTTQSIPSYNTKSEFQKDNSYPVMAIPLDDKIECVKGVAECYQAGVACSSPEPATQTACENKKYQHYLKCEAYKISWGIPCTAGIKIPMAMTTVGDIEGRGKQQVIEINGSESNGDLKLWSTRWNGSSGNGSFEKYAVSGNLPGMQYKTFSSMGFGDINGDGKMDFAYSDGTKLQVLFARSNPNDAGFDNPEPKNNVTAASYGGTNWLLDKPDFKWRGTLVDIDGDARADYVARETDSTLAIYLSNGRTFKDKTSVNVEAVIRNNGEEEEAGQFLDINNDGRPEYVFVRQTDEGGLPDILVYYFPSNLSGAATSKRFRITNAKDSRNRWFTDINSDGKIDFVIQNQDGPIDVSFFDGAKFSNPPTKMTASSNAPYATKDNKVKKFFADINGDGFVDYVRSFDDNFHVSFGNGKHFNDGSVNSPNGFTRGGTKFWNMADFDGDGFPDLIGLRETESSEPLLRQFVSKPMADLTDAAQSNFTHNIDKHIGNVNNISGRLQYSEKSTFGRSDLGQAWNKGIQGIAKNVISTMKAVWQSSSPKISPSLAFSILQILASNPQPNISQVSYLQVHFQNPRRKENQITQVDGGFGRTIKIDYVVGKDYVGETSPASGNYPIIPHVGLGEVVKSVTTNQADLLTNTDSYTYSDSRIWLGNSENAAMLGFKVRTVSNSLTGVNHTEQYNHSSNLLAGTVVSSITKNGIGEIQQTSSSSYTVQYPLGRPSVVIASSEEDVFKDASLLLHTTQSMNYDSYGNIASKTISSGGSTITETANYAYDTTRWILTRPTLTKKDIDGVPIENTIYSYSDNKNITVTSMAGTVAAATSYITLDDFGNQQSVKDPLGRTTTYEYDNVVHNYVTKVTNPANFTVTKTYDTSFGLELTALDANGAVITKRYDNKGRLSEIIPPGADSYVERYAYTDYASGGAYFTSVSKSIVNPDGTETTASEYFDILGRSVRKESPGVQGKFIVEITEYDTKGQVSRKSSPYLDTLETPMYTTYTYHPYDGYVTKITNPDGSYSIPTYTGFNEKMEAYAADGTILSSTEIIKNAKGQVLTRTIDGKSLNYQYDTAGRLTKILDPEGSATTTAYDNAGRKTSVTDANSGTTVYTYDAVGNIKTQKDARNLTTTFTYDNLNRPTSVSYSNGEGNTVLTYDEGGKNKFALGRLTTVVDDAGKLELGYDIKGNRTYQKRIIDDLEIIFKRDYDIQSRLASTTYPDGTKVYQKYATTGHFSGITMDTADGRSKGYTVGSYNGPVIENGVFKIIRETGNGVKMEIEYDPIKRRPKGLVTKLASGHVEGAVSYTYDQKNNITKIADTIVNGRTQDFVYDAQNRLTQASGKYGTENYTYSDNGNLTQRGQFTLAYGDANHKHAVTAVTSPSTGTFNYSYDEAGNMISRNGDTMSYNSQGKLKQIDTEGGDKLTYLYESTGNRIKKTSKTSGVVVYSFDGLYEIAKTPGEGDKHTLYFKGLYGDMFSQMTRNDAQLVTQAVIEPVEMSTSDKSFISIASFRLRSMTDLFCEDIAGSCSDYYTNSLKYYYVQSAFKVARVVYSVEYNVFVWMLLVVVLYGVYLVSNKKVTVEQRAVIVDSTGSPTKLVEMTTSDKSFISIAAFRLRSLELMTSFFDTLHDSWFAKRTLSVTPLLTVAILFTFTQCGIIGGGKTKGNAPWLLLASGVNSNTPSVDDTSNGNSSGASGSSGGSSLVPVVGMYFLHPDHLGSITMITDGRGNVIAGGNNGGKSHISYTPYGSIHRTDSSGPDITRFKYTGQEEDKESGLIYYKARYYDPMIGRFLQADSVVMPESTFGMNRYMYVEGNPVRYGDASGHRLSTPQGWALLGALVAPQYGISSEWGAAIGAGIGRKENIREKKQHSLVNKGIEVGKLLVSPVYRLYKAIKSLPSFDEMEESLVGKRYFDSNEGKFNKGLQAGFLMCASNEDKAGRRNGNVWQACIFMTNYLQSYNNHRQAKSDNTNIARKGVTFHINYENIVGCAILLKIIGDYSNPRPTQGIPVGGTGEPSPTNTSNGETYDPPNRLNGCITMGGDG